MPGPRKAGKEEMELVTRVGMRKVRVICTDPDATESSSDEHDEELKRAPLQKRVVREIFIPALVSPQEAAGESFYARSIRDSCKVAHIIPHSSSSSAFPLLSCKKILNKSSSKRRPKKWRLRQVNSMSTGSQDLFAETGKKACRYIGVRQRRWGKWTAELREPSQGLRMWLGTFDTAKEAAIAYDEAARRLKGAEAITNFGVPSSSSSFPPPDFGAGQLSKLSSENWSAVDMCADDNALLLSCGDLEAVEDCFLAYSPSSVLDQSTSSDSGLRLCSPSSVLESAFIDDCASAPFQAYDIVMAGGKGLKECNRCRHMPLRCDDELKMNLASCRGKADHSVKHEPPALEEPFFEVLGELFDYEGSNFAREERLTQPEPVSFEALSAEEGANLMSFELDAEALTWINLQP